MAIEDIEIRVGVSTCLMGEEVRFDGQGKRDGFVTDSLAEFVELIPVCPEVESGMSIPRPTIRLHRREDGEVRLVQSRDNSIDHTEQMREFSQRRIAELEELDLGGYIFKSKSPSCGVHRIQIYEDGKQPLREGRGMFADAFIKAFPEVPVEEEGRLRDIGIRESFVERLFAYARLRQLFRPGWTIGELVAFHSREKLLLLAHHPATYKSLGPIVASAKQRDRAELEAEYRAQFLEAMAARATRGTHVNVLQHIMGYFKEHLDSSDRQAVVALIDDYHKKLVPLIVPITLLRFFVRRHGVDYLAMQSYLNPHPKELMLRNHV